MDNVGNVCVLHVDVWFGSTATEFFLKVLHYKSNVTSRNITNFYSIQLADLRSRTTMFLKF